MKKETIYISDLHFDHKLWKSQLTFQADELTIFTHRLEEVVVRWTDKDVLKRVEHFQNAFIRHKEVIDILIHDINAHEHKLSHKAQSQPVAIDHVHFDDHTDERKRVEDQIRIFYELKTDFLRFLSEAM